MPPTLLPLHPFGPPDAPPVVCLHGFLGSGADWSAFAERLAPRFRVVAPDLPGHGAALGLPEETYGMAGAGEALLATLDAAGILAAPLVGYSMGGRLALWLAIEAPTRFPRLVLESASPGLETESDREARRHLDATRAQALRKDLPAFLESWYGMPLFATLTPSQRARLVQERAGGDATELACSLVGMGTGMQPDLWPRLPALGVPTLAVAGARDEKFVRIARRMEATSAHVRARVLPNAGHNVHLERPEEFAAAVAGFL